jgi:hypothetical protein
MQRAAHPGNVSETLSVECMGQRLACSPSRRSRDDLQVRLSERARSKRYPPHLQGCALRVNAGIVLPGTPSSRWARLRKVRVEEILVTLPEKK